MNEEVAQTAVNWSSTSSTDLADSRSVMLCPSLGSESEGRLQATTASANNDDAKVLHR